MSQSNKTIAVIGAGPAGIEAANLLSKLGHSVVVIERQAIIGGHLRNWDRLFPNQYPAKEVLETISAGLASNTRVFTGVEVNEVKENHGFELKLSDNSGGIIADAVLLTTGFELFDARRKEEYGYGIYDHVFTSVDLEAMLKSQNLPIRRDGNPLKRLAFIHCVGSRDEKAGVQHCSRVCCITAVKQAIEVKELLPEAEIFLFYMDLRMFGLGYEELYKEAQEKYQIRFIRGRLSESFENQDGTIMLKVEDTLAGKPLRMNVDLMVLMVGMLPSSGTQKVADKFGVSTNINGFLTPEDVHAGSQLSGKNGVFLAGTCKGPKNLEETLNDARAAVIRVDSYLKSLAI